MMQTAIFKKVFPVSLASMITLIALGSLLPSAAQSIPTATGLPTGLATSAITESTATGESVTLMVGGLGKIIYMPAELASQLGYFADEGLNVSVVDQPAGIDATTQMLAGKVDGVVAFYDHTIDAQGAGKALESVVQLSNVPGEYVLVSSKITTPINSTADFKGRTFGVGALGSSTQDLLVRYLASQAGVNPGTLNRIVTGDAGTSVITAFESGQIDAGLVTEPTASLLIQKGDARRLIDLSDPESVKQTLGGQYPGASLYLTTDYITAHPATVQKLVNALVRTLRWIHVHSAEQIVEMLPTAYVGADKALYLTALTSSLPVFTVDGAIATDGLANVLTIENALNRHVQGKAIDLSLTYTNKFVNAANLALGPLPTLDATNVVSTAAPLASSTP